MTEINSHEKFLMKQNLLLKDEANNLVYKMGLSTVLESFGKIHISGSYALDLMTWRDLDIYLETDLISEQRFFQLGGELNAMLSPLRMHFRNERNAKTDGLPDGLYWGIYLGDERQGAWKIDVWAVCEKELDRLIKYCEAIREQLDDTSSSTILSIKSQCWQDPEYRRVYSSAHIYEAVLKGGVRNLQGFWNYLDVQTSST